LHTVQVLSKPRPNSPGKPDSSNGAPQLSILTPWTVDNSQIKRVEAQVIDSPSVAGPAAALPVSPGCATCGRQGGGLPPYDSRGRCSSCGQGQCAPGRKPCYPCEAHTPLGGFLCDLYECICCQDPCYE